MDGWSREVRGLDVRLEVLALELGDEGVKPLLVSLNVDGGKESLDIGSRGGGLSQENRRPSRADGKGRKEGRGEVRSEFRPPAKTLSPFVRQSTSLIPPTRPSDDDDSGRTFPPWARSM